jgi:hypothetical protein
VSGVIIMPQISHKLLFFVVEQGTPTNSNILGQHLTLLFWSSPRTVNRYLWFYQQHLRNFPKQLLPSLINWTS